MASIASPTGTARIPTQGSWRPLVAISTSSPSMVTVRRGVVIELVGLTAKRTTMSWPVELPPRMQPGDGAGGHPAGGLARRRAAAAAIVADAVLGPVGVVGVPRAEAVLDLAVILGALVLVLDQQADRRAGGQALEHAGEDLDPVGL